MVRMLNTLNLHMDFGLAKMQEENVISLKRMARVGSIPPWVISNPVNPPEKREMVPIQRLTVGQMKDRRDMWFCYNCDDKWGPNHKYKLTRLFIMEGEDSQGEGA